MKLLRYIFVGVLFVALFSNQVIAQNYKWVKGTTLSLNTQKIVKDKEGSTIITGTFSGNVDIDFSDDTAKLYGGGSFVAKYNMDGDFIWGEKLGDNSDAPIDISAVQTDDSGNVYVAGSFSGVVDFNPSTLAADTAIERSLYVGGFYPCIYVAKYDSTGKFIWVMNLGGTLPELWDMKIKNEKLYVTGAITTYPDAPDGFKDVDFNPSKMPADTFFLTGAPGTTEFELNPFFAAYDLNAELLVAKRINTTPAIKGFNIDVDENENIYIVGNLVATHDLNASLAAADTFFLTGTQGVFLASYTNTGSFRWAAPVLQEDNYGFVFPENPILLKVAGDGIYVSGLFKSTVDFNPGTSAADTFNLTASTGGIGSSYLAHYDTAGNFIFAGTLGASGSGDRIDALASDDSGHLYIAGEFNGTADFNLSPLATDTFRLKSAGEEVAPDVFFAKYRNDTFMYARKIGNAESQNISGMAVDNNFLTIFGVFGGDVVFNPVPPVDLSSKLSGGGTYLATYRTFLRDDKELLTYSFSTPPATGTITALDSVLLTVPSGTDVTGLIADFTISASAHAFISDTEQESGITSNDFSDVLTYTIVAENGTTRDYFIKVTVEDVGIEDVAGKNAKTFKVWPNPTNGILYLEQPSVIKVYNIQGKLLLTTERSKSINLQLMPPGIYIIENERAQRKKIVIR